MKREMQHNIIYRSKDDDAVEYILCLHNNGEPAALIETSSKDSLFCIS